MDKKILVLELTKSEARLTYGSISQDDFEILFAERKSLLSSDGLELAPAEQGTVLHNLLESLKKQFGVGNLALVPTILVLPSENLLVRDGNSRSYSTNSGSGLNRLDYRNCLFLISQEGKEPGYKSLCFLPYLFSCDGEDKEQFPLGERFESLSVHADHYLLPESAYENYRRLVLSLGLKPYLTYFENLAACHYLPRNEKRREFFLLNLSEEATVLSLVKDNRLIDNHYWALGLDAVAEKISEKYRLSLKDASFLIRLFGYESPEPDLPYPIPAIRSTSEFRKTIEDLYDSLILSKIRSTIDLLDEPHHVPNIVYGTATELIGSENMLSARIPRLYSAIRTRVIGANSQAFLPTLGALRLAYEKYQTPLADVVKVREDDAIRETAFGRNERN